MAVWRMIWCIGLGLLLALGGVLPGYAAVPGFSEIITPQNAGQLAQVAEVDFGPWNLVMAVAWSPDGAHLAVSAGEYIYLYAASTWKQVSAYRVGAFTHGLAFSPDGTWLAAASRDGYLRLWTAQDFQARADAPPVLAVQAHRKGANTVLFSPDGSLLASGGNDAVARFWDPASGTVLGLMIGGTFAVPSAAFLPDGETLAVINGDRIRLRQVGSERIVGTFAAEATLYSVAVSPDGTLLAAGGSDNLVRVWDPKTAYRTGQEHYPDPLLLAGHSGKAGSFQALIWRVSFSPDGRLLASAGGDGTLRLWDPSAGTLLASLLAHPNGAACLAFRPGGEQLASGGLDGVLRIWGINR